MKSMHLIEHMNTPITILLLDFKNEYGDIPDKLGRDKWLYFDPSGDFRLGWNPPSKCRDHHGWNNNLTRIIRSVCGLNYSEGTLAIVDQIGFNILNNPIVSPVQFPSPRLIEEMLDYLPREMIATKDMYLESVRQQIRFLRRVSKNLLEAERGFDIFEHLIDQNKCAVINCSQLPLIIADLLVNIISFQFSFVKVSLNETSKQTTFVMIVDEGDPFCSKEAASQFPEGFTQFGKGYKQDRGFGGMKITGLSSFDKCCPIILGNTSNLFASKQAYADATTAVSRALLEPQSQQFIDTQDVGHTIFKGTTGNIRYGLPTIVDHEPIEPMLTPPGYDSHPFTAARGIDEIPGFREELDKLIDQFRSSQTRAKMYKRKKAVKLTENQINFLKTVSLNEYEPAKQIWDNLGNPSPSVRGKIIKQLVNRNYIESKIMRCRSPHQLVRLTEKGWEYVKGKSKYLATRGDLIHAHVCIWICMLGVLRRYEKSLCEMQVPGTSGYCDAGHLIDGRWHLYEVAIECFDNIPKHVKTAFIESDADIASLTIVTLTKSDHTKAEQIILADPEIAFCINKIQFLTAEELMKELWPQ